MSKEQAEIAVLQSARDAFREDLLGRLQKLQDASIRRLEELSEDSAGWLSMSKESAAHKFILGDLLAAQIHSAKMNLQAEPGEKDDEEDDEELARIMAEA